MSMGQTWRPFKILTENFSEAHTCTIWNYTITSTTGQKENANERQTFEHRPKMWQNFTKKIDPRLNQFGPDHHRRILLYKPGLKKPSLQAILKQFKCDKRLFTYRNPKSTSKIPCTKPTNTIHGACTWLRRNPEYCAQRRTLLDFDVWNPSQIHFLR